MRHGGVALVLTCEHGGNEVPRGYRSAFTGHGARRALNSHRGYDLGALEIATRMANALGAPLFAAKVTRLLVDLNRSLHHPNLWSEYSRTLSERDKAAIIEDMYRPHRDAIHNAIAAVRGRPVLHVAVHSFTPKLGDQVRTADVGLLYDPARPRERALCRQWAVTLGQGPLHLQVRRNYPYKGISDGLTRWLRQQFSDRQYAGVELEVNQALATGRDRQSLARHIVASLRATYDRA